MSRISYPRNVQGLLSGTDTLLVVAPQAAFEDGTFLEVLPEEHMRLSLALARDLRPGDLGEAAGTLTESSPKKLGVGVLPDEVSRYNAPSRAAAVAKVVAQSNTGKNGKAGVLLVLDDGAHAAAAVSAIAGSLPLFSLKSGQSKEPSLKVLAIDTEGQVLPISEQVKVTAGFRREAARLVDTPPTEMDPAQFQKEAWKLSRGLEGVTKRAIIGPKLLEAGLGGIHGVGRTALSAPRLLQLSYKPKRASKLHIALVGKGVTYDTGGLSIKSTAGMCGMKADMGGAAAVLGAFLSLAKAGSPHRVSAVLCMAENAVGPASFKNDDVLRMHSGLTVEINNTDAEGRLLLGDGVSYAARKLKATHVLDAATLTGAQLIATGKNHAAVVSNDAELEATLVEAGRASGDLTHALPFAPEFYTKEFASQVADMKNSVADRMNAQCSCAGIFVHAHLASTEAKWGHVDMAGPSFIGGRGTGYGVALLAEAVRSIGS